MVLRYNDGRIEFMSSFSEFASRCKRESTAPGIPRPSPIQVLTRPNVALLDRSDEMSCFQRGMAVDILVLDEQNFVLLIIDSIGADLAFTARGHFEGGNGNDGWLDDKDKVLLNSDRI
ncbi:unnamed protein product [Thelazia callipaeda]|uniref:Uncharacterized protein n=1 Tax=Thelazia callipaeda TaxID=103827 RepID=A0A0N5DC87_THECL|nr:unnamed protein product [Thelazia callipaeda]